MTFSLAYLLLWQVWLESFHGMSEGVEDCFLTGMTDRCQKWNFTLMLFSFLKLNCSVSKKLFPP